VHDLALDVTGCLCLQDLRERVTQTVTHVSGVARVTLLGEINPGVDVRVSDLANCAPHLDGFLVRVGGLRAGYDLDAIAREPTVRGQFVVDVRAAAMPPDEERRVITAGLRALDGRDDLEVL
jgi:DNA repair protein SbcD/Mre11